jgi:hypothetical protein
MREGRMQGARACELDPFTRHARRIERAMSMTPQHPIGAAHAWLAVDRAVVWSGSRWMRYSSAAAHRDATIRISVVGRTRRSPSVDARRVHVSAHPRAAPPRIASAARSAARDSQRIRQAANANAAPDLTHTHIAHAHHTLTRMADSGWERGDAKERARQRQSRRCASQSARVPDPRRKQDHGREVAHDIDVHKPRLRWFRADPIWFILGTCTVSRADFACSFVPLTTIECIWRAW